MIYRYFGVPYRIDKDIYEQINEVCAKKENVRYHSTQQSISNIKDLKTGMPKVTMVLVFEEAFEGFVKPEAEA